MERHKSIPFPSPFDLIEEDPERKLWVPGRKRIFLPTPKIHYPPTPSIWAPIDFNYLEALRVDYMQREYQRAYYRCECVPSRSLFIVPVPVKNSDRSVQDKKVPMTWNDITRSTTPVFRNRRFGS